MKWGMERRRRRRKKCSASSNIKPGITDEPETSSCFISSRAAIASILSGSLGVRERCPYAPLTHTAAYFSNFFFQEKTRADYKRLWYDAKIQHVLQCQRVMQRHSDQLCSVLLKKRDRPWINHTLSPADEELRGLTWEVVGNESKTTIYSGVNLVSNISKMDKFKVNYSIRSQMAKTFTKCHA